MFVDDALFGVAALQIDVADEEGDLVVLVQRQPDVIGKGLGVRGVDDHLAGLTLKGGEGIQVLLIGVDKVTLAGQRVLVAEELAAAGGGIALGALQNGQGIAAVLVEELVGDTIFRGELQEALRNVTDIERVMTRIVTGSVNCRDLLGLAGGLRALPEIKRLLTDRDSSLLQSLLLCNGSLICLRSSLC